MEITSAQNPKIKLLKKLKTKKYRDQTGLFLLEGLKSIALAFEEETVLEGIFVEKGRENLFFHTLSELPHSRSDLIYIVPKELLLPLYDTDSPQGILAIARRQTTEFNLVYKESMQRILLLDRVQDPGNLGTIVRTADAAGWDLVLCTTGCADLYNPKTIRSTMGSILTMKLAQDADGLSALKFLKERGFQVFCATLENGFDFKGEDKKGPLVLVLGNEGSGIDPRILEVADRNVFIPMYGKAESLNVSVAAGILMYHFLDTP